MVKRLFGSVRKRGKHFYGRYRVEGRDYYTPATRTISETRHLLDLVHAEILTGVWTPTPRKKSGDDAPAPALRQCAGKVLDYLDKRGASPNTVRAYKSTLTAHILPFMGDMPVTGITTHTAAAFYNHLKSKRITEQTTENVMGHTRAIFGHLIRLGYIDANPIKWDKPRYIAAKKTRRGKALTGDRLAALLKVIPTPTPLAFALMSYCALRYGECAALTARDIKHTPDGYTVTVSKALKRAPGGGLVVGTPKNAASYRTIAIPAHLNDLTACALAAAGGGSDFLFTNPRHPHGYCTDRYWRRQLNDGLASLGLPGMRLHDLRHTGLTLYGLAGATLADLMYRAGHADLDSVRIYQHSSDQRDRELANLM